MVPVDNLAACPKYEDLVAFNSGSLPLPALEAIGAHLGQCSTCVSTLGSVVDDEGREVRAFRHSLLESEPNPFASDPEYLRMEQWVNQILATESGNPPQPTEASLGAVRTPRALGPYQIGEKIGQGGMGAVYRALHTRLKKPVAVKILPPDRTQDARAVARFNREMEAVGRLDHHNIVRATDAGEAEGVHFLVMELIHGMDLARLVRLRGPVGIADACELIRQAATGLQYAHQHGLVHRDIKPSNLLVSVQGEVKVLDLGLALLSHNGLGSGDLTVSGQVMGTADYMAPEQWEASHAVDIRADIYSLGCTLYTLLVGRPPFGGAKYGSGPRKMAAHVHQPVPLVTLQRSDVPAALEDFLMRMVTKDPDKRPGTPSEVASALQPFCAGADLAALTQQTMALQRPALMADPSTRAGGATPRTAPGKSTARPQTQGSRWYRRTALVAGFLGLLSVAVVLYLQPWAGSSEQAPQPQPPAPGLRPPDPGGWQQLLKHKPVKRFWTERATNLFHYDEASETLALTSAKAALVRLGETNAQSYTLQIGFRQTRWVGFIGLYFGGQPQPQPGADFRCQLITCYPLEPQGLQPFGLVRAIGTPMQQAPGIMPHVNTKDVASMMLGIKPGITEQLLEIDVKPFGLASVRWNGEFCAELVSPKASERARAADYQGEFGIFCDGSSAIISTARYLAVE
jgi:serine/threonine protein kinase